jgi:hypothetical protein
MSISTSLSTFNSSKLPDNSPPLNFGMQQSKNWVAYDLVTIWKMIPSSHLFSMRRKHFILACTSHALRQPLIIVESCSLASEFVANLGLSGGSGISSVQIVMAVLTLVFKILKIILILWESEVEASRTDHIVAPV